MTADVGFGMTIVALVLALYGGVVAAVGARTGRAALVESAQHAALGVFTLVTACFALLAYAFPHVRLLDPLRRRRTPTSARPSTTASPASGARSRAPSSSGPGCWRSTR
jgi:hypothetical protein